MTTKSTPLNLLLQESQAKHSSLSSAQLSKGEHETMRGMFPEVWK